ncbi:MAG: NAD-dependent epimerase/dehydratase family protein [Actinomycetia bacterium]|nr:NAD-dependent epimerase/dehydratase family protein [Actinomycetes bacterium]
MKILITGGAGFIGSNLAHYLLALDGEVMVIDDLSSGYSGNIDPRSEFRKLDICRDEFLAASAAFDPDVIVHLAAQSSVSIGETEPEFTRKINVDGTRRVIEAAIASDVERLVFASSAAVYGVPQELPLVETAPLAPINVYGETKLAGEELIREMLDPTALDYALLRFSNVYGPRQTAEGEGGVVSCFCEALAKGKTPVIFGDGHQVRDFVYVADVVEALTSTIGGDIAFRDFGAEATEDTSDDRGVFNISSGHPVTIEQLLNGMRVPANFGGSATFEPERPGDIRESILSPRKAREVFEWEANIDLAQGLDNTWMWHWRQMQ